MLVTSPSVADGILSAVDFQKPDRLFIGAKKSHSPLDLVKFCTEKVSCPLFVVRPVELRMPNPVKTICENVAELVGFFIAFFFLSSFLCFFFRLFSDSEVRSVPYPGCGPCR
jgi:hypothetical protein